MNSRTLLTLVAALAVLVALALAVSVSQRPATTTGDLLLPDLKSQINDVSRLVVTAGGNKVVATLERGERGWTLKERDGYPADVGRIRRNLIALSEARTLEEKTSNPEFYGRLKVEDVDKAGAAGLRLDITAGDKTTGVIVGTTGVSGGERTYVRRAGEPASWLVSGNLDVARDTADWLDRVVTAVPATRVRSVVITHPDGKSLRIGKADAAGIDFSVRDLPAGRELSFPGAANAIGAALADLSFDNVEPAAGFAPAEARPVVARFETVDGLVVTASTWRLAEGSRVRFEASAEEALASQATPPAAAPAEDKGASPAAGAPRPFAEVQAEARALNDRVAGWVYRLPEYKTEQLTRRMDDLLAAKTVGPPKP